MTLDVNEIVLNKIKELDEKKVIEKAIEEKIESVIKQAVDNAFSWNFSNEISKKIREQVGGIAESVKLNSYNTVVADTVRNIVEAELNEDLARKVQTRVKELLLAEGPVQFSDIVKKFREVKFDDDEGYEYSVTETDSYGGSGLFEYKKLVFERTDADDEDMNWYIQFSRFNNEKWTVSLVKYEGKLTLASKGFSTLKSCDGFECLIWKCILNDLPIEIDWSASECEDGLFQSGGDGC